MKTTTTTEEIACINNMFCDKYNVGYVCIISIIYSAY